MVLHGHDGLDEVRLLGRRGNAALAAPLLRAVNVRRLPLDVAFVRDRHDDFDVRHEVFERDFREVVDDLRAPLVAEAVFEFRLDLVVLGYRYYNPTKVGALMAAKPGSLSRRWRESSIPPRLFSDSCGFAQLSKRANSDRFAAGR